MITSLRWTIPSVDRIMDYAGKNDQVIGMLHLLVSGLTGFFNSCVYATSPGTWELFKKKVFLWKNKIFGVCKKKKKVDGNETIEEEKESHLFLSTNFIY